MCSRLLRSSARRVLPFLAAAALLVLPTAASAQAAPPMAVHDAYLAALNGHDVQGILALFADEAVISPGGSILAGKDQIRGFYQHLVDANVQLAPRDRQVAGDRLTWSWRYATDDYRALGVPHVDGQGEMLIRGGKIRAATFGHTPESAANLETAQVRTAATPAGCIDSPLMAMGDSGITGSARLCSGDAGVRASIASSNLAAGDAYTAWFVYFDQPSTCKATPCSPPDVLGDDPAGVLGRMDALVADASGASVFSGELRGLRLSSGSEVHLPIFGHGRANADDNRARARQLLTPEDPTLGAPGLGVPAAHPEAGPVAVALFDIP